MNTKFSFRILMLCPHTTKRLSLQILLVMKPELFCCKDPIVTVVMFYFCQCSFSQPLLKSQFCSKSLTSTKRNVTFGMDQL